MLWAFVDVLGRRLVLWSVPSIVVGAALLAGDDPLRRGLGVMLIAWGAADGAIGVTARVAADRARRRRRAGGPDTLARDTARVRLLLRISAVLDVGYLAVGGSLVLWSPEPFWVGAGWGILVQGGFLLAFDLFHARRVPPPTPILPADLDLFTGAEHAAFRLSALAPDGSEPPGPRDGALLLHGFGGTPAELRSVAALLAADGWVVEVPLLPGFGPEIRSLPDVRLEDWVAEVRAATDRLGAEAGGRLLVAGHSMGAALALVTARELRPDALVLLAPFWWPQPAWMRVAGSVVAAVLPPGIRPFRRIDLDGRDVREGLGGILAGMDLDDPEVRRGLRELTVPMSVFGELFRVSGAARSAARRLRTPTLVVQGTGDEIARPDRTRRLVAAFATAPRYVEVDAGHGLTTDASPARDETLAHVLAFAREARTRPPVVRPRGAQRTRGSLPG